MSVVSINPVSGSVVIPDPLRPQWRSYEINLEGGQPFPFPTDNFNASVGASAFIDEPGKIHALQFGVPSLDTFVFQYEGMGSDPTFRRTVDYYLHFPDAIGDPTSQGSVLYRYISQVDTTGPPGSIYDGSLEEVILTVDLRGNFLQDETTATPQANAYDGTTNNPLVLYGLPYLNRRGLFGAEFNKQSNGNGLGLQYTAASYQAIPFGFEIETPCTVDLYVQQTWSINTVGGTITRFNPPLVDPKKLILNVLWEPAPPTEQFGAVWHTDRALITAINSGTALSIRRQSDPHSAAVQTATIPDARNAVLYQKRNGKSRTGTFELIAQQISTKQWKLWRSLDGAKTWTMAGSPFQSPKIDHLSAVPLANGAAIIGIIKGATTAQNRLVFKRTADVANWPADDDAVTVRTGVANKAVQLLTQGDGKATFSITGADSALGWLTSRNGGANWT